MPCWIAAMSLVVDNASISSDAGLLRAEVFAGDDPALTQPAARGDPAAESAAALDDNNSSLGSAFERGALLGGRAARRKTGRDDAARPGSGRCIDQRAVGAGVGIDDVDPRQRRGEIEAENAVSGVWARNGER